MRNIKGKKILVLGGASVHVKLVKAAQEMGAYVIVADNVPVIESPGKQIADEAWDINIYDVELLVQKSVECGVEGVISGWLDPCQRPYQKICEKLNLPCYGSEEQFMFMTDKHAFKNMCHECGVDTIPEYTREDIDKGQVVFPVFVKPIDSRGSRGQSVCYTMEELTEAIKYASSESSNGDYIVEKYIRGSQEFHVTYFFVDGEPYLLRASDNYCGSESMHMEKVVSCAVMPSKFTEKYLETTHAKVVKMFKKLGIKNGPIFMQGFEDNGVFRFFDPGLRFPGVDFELVFKEVFGIDLMKAMVQIAFWEKCDLEIPKDAVKLDGKNGAVLYLTVKACHITKLSGEDEVKCNPNVVSYLPRCKEGDVIPWSYNVNQRLAELDLLSENIEELKKTIDFVHKTIVALDENNEDAIFARFDTKRIKR